MKIHWPIMLSAFITCVATALVLYLSAARASGYDPTVRDPVVIAAPCYILWIIPCHRDAPYVDPGDDPTIYIKVERPTKSKPPSSSPPEEPPTEEPPTEEPPTEEPPTEEPPAPPTKCK